MLSQSGHWNPTTQIAFIGGRSFVLPSNQRSIYEVEGLFDELDSHYRDGNIAGASREAFAACGLWTADVSVEVARSPIDRFNLMRRLPFADYSQSGVLESDRDLMGSYEEDSYPPIALHYDGPRSYLSHPALTNAIQHDAAQATLLFAAFGRQRTARLHEQFPVLLKCVPSCGARHAFEAFLEVGGGVGQLTAGIYHYNVAEHALVFLAGGSSSFQGVRLHVAAVFDRVQWRYRTVVGYLDLLVDLGHVLETVYAMAVTLGLRVKTVPAHTLQVPNEELIAELLVCLEITETHEELTSE